MNSSVQTEQRINWFSLLTIWFGGLISVPSLLIGSTLIAGLSFYEALFAGLIGFSVVCLFMCLESVAAVDTRLTTVQLASSAFGRNGANILVGLVVGASCLGWFGVQSNIAGASFSKIMALSFDLHIPAAASTIFWGTVMMLTAVFGFKYLKVFNYIAVPCKILLIVYGLIVSFQGRSFSTVTTYQPTTHIDFIVAVGLCIGFFSVGGVISPDYSRFAKTRKDAIIGSVLGLLPAALMLMAVGSILAIFQGTYDIVEIFAKMGYPAAALAVLIIATWTTNVMNAYSSGLALNQLLHWPERRQHLSIIVAGVLGTALGAMGILGKFMSFLMILTVTIPPVAGVLISDYWIARTYAPDKLQAFNWKGLVAWACGVAVMLLLENPIKNVLGILVSLVMYYIFQINARKSRAAAGLTALTCAGDKSIRPG